MSGNKKVRENVRQPTEAVEGGIQSVFSREEEGEDSNTIDQEPCIQGGAGSVGRVVGWSSVLG